VVSIPLAFGLGFINPSLSSLISKSVSAKEQGSTMGISQGLGSLARATGPFLGLLTFGISIELPYLIAATISMLLLLLNWELFFHKNSQQKRTL
jgi:fucose permease